LRGATNLYRIGGFEYSIRVLFGALIHSVRKKSPATLEWCGATLNGAIGIVLREHLTGIINIRKEQNETNEVGYC
jgi:hypothetical protein